jgi:bifunctional non-homologous end joining protein LigD
LALEKYREKRNAERTPEPFGGAPISGARDRGMFIVQKHAARRLHYDFRLEMEGVLRSWAVPKGPSLNPRERRLAVMVEDHPIEYGDFEGAIPEGNYGAGAVIGWDRGEYRVIDPSGADAAQAVRDGKLDIEMRGYKLRGAYTLVRTRGDHDRRADSRQQWLLIKKRDEFASEERDLLGEHPRSVLSGLTIEEIRDPLRIGREAAGELAQIGAPALKVPYTAASFPLSFAKILEHPFDGADWLFELKYDGVRALALRDGVAVRIFGRGNREITTRYPEAVLALSALPFERFALDGEIVVPDEQGRPSFQLLQHRIHVAEPRESARLSLSLPVNYWVFDLLAFGDSDLRGLALEDRKRILAGLIRGEGSVRYCDHVAERGRDFFNAAAEAHLEGIMAKRRGAPYRGVRTGDWVKIKCPRLGNFVIGGWTEPGGSRAHFGALLLGQYDPSGELRFISRVGSGFDERGLRDLHKLLSARETSRSPFRPVPQGEAGPPRKSHFCAPDLVCEVRFGEYTESGGIRHPIFQRLVDDVNPRECVFGGQAQAEPDKQRGAAANSDGSAASGGDRSAAGKSKSRKPRRAEAASTDDRAEETRPAANEAKVPAHGFKLTNPGKIFWPDEGYSKGDLVHYYETIAPWMLPYLKDRPVVLTRYPNGIAGKSFFQKDAPAFTPSWIRTEKIYSHDSRRDIAYFVLESPEAIAYMANMGAIPIHIWSSRFPHLERPDWLLFDIDPKGSTTATAAIVALETAAVLREIGMRPYVKTSGQMGIHVVVGLQPEYTYEQARMFSEMAGSVVVKRIPESATLLRDHAARKGRTYIDYLQLGQGKTIAAPFAVRPMAGAPVSAPLGWNELTPSIQPGEFNIKTMPARMERLKADPFLGALTDLQRIEPALPKLEEMLRAAR